jgi:ribosomal protein S18 acetylase RimI-like enzyme
MGVTYFKRYRMEFDLTRSLFALPALSADYSLLPWSDKLLPVHAEVKYRSFRDELDANVFPCLGDRDGCRRLMEEISARPGFLPESTWLIQYWPGESTRPDLCGTIQGVIDSAGVGAIQNVGVTTRHRGRGLGSALLYYALEGFQQAGLRRAFLEVTAQNTGAVRLYHRLGFRTTKTVYKAAEVVYA